MKIASLNFLKRNMICALLTASAILAASAAQEARSAALSMTAIIQEETGFRPGCGSGFGGTLSGTGISPLLGAVSVEGSDCITPVTPISFFFDGEMTFTVSNGDEIFADYHGFLTATSIPSVFSFKSGEFTIEGGTGNFLHAEGGGKLTGTEVLRPDFSGGWGVIQMIGKISNFTKDNNSSKKEKGEKDKDQKAGNDATLVTGLDSSLLPVSNNLGNSSQDSQLLVTAVPESGSLALLGIGFASLALIRRRKLANLVPAPCF